MEQFIQNILIGVRQWVNGKLEDLSFVISSHINELTGRMTTAEDKLDGIEDGAQVNKIETITVNGQAATISGKAATVAIPEATTSASGVMGAADKTKLDGIATGAQVNVIETVKVNGTALTPDANKAVDVIIPAATVTGVKSGELVLGLDGTELTSTLTLNYDSASSKIQLKGKNNALVSEIDATDFIKDGMLDSASVHTRKTTEGTTTWTPALPQGVTEPSGTVDGTYIVLVWNTDAGKSATFVNATSLVDIYTAGTGISIDANREISLNQATKGDSAQLGGVKVGDGIALANDGTISITAPTVEQVLAVLEAEEEPTEAPTTEEPGE